MKIFLDATTLKEAIVIAQRFTGKTTMSITKGMRLEIGNEYLIVESTDFDYGVKIKVPLKSGEGTGAIVVDGDKFSRIVRTSPSSSDLQLEAKKNVLRITSSVGGFDFKLALMQESQFPKLPAPPRDAEVKEVKVEELIAVLDKVKFATNKGTDKVFEEVVFLRGQRAFATDTFKIGIADASSLDLQLDIPANTIPLIKLLSGVVHLSSTSEIIFLQSPTMLITLRRLLAREPQILKIAAEYSNPPVSYALTEEQVKEFKEHLRRTKIVDNVIHILPKKDALVCGARNAEGEYRFSLPLVATVFEMVPKPLCFNADFLSEALQHLTTLELSFFGPRQPLSIKAKRFICLLQSLADTAVNMEGE